MERIKNIWAQLESDENKIAGFYKVRYSEESLCDLFLGLKYPEKQRMLMVEVPFSLGIKFKLKYEFKGLRFDKIQESLDSESILLNLVLVEKQLTDVFNSLIADIILAIKDVKDPNLFLKIYSERLLKWQSLFEKLSNQGMSLEAQRGLYGELYLLRKLLTLNNNYYDIIDSWKGPEKLVRDFQHGTWSIEVKTTHGNNHQKVHINSERQLDTNNLEFLYLYHISLDTLNQSGETLNNIIDSIGETIKDDFSCFNYFNMKLMEAGYFVFHKSFYEKTGYLLRFENFYKVEGNFPRIEECDVRAGVGDVKYSIVISQCTSYITEELNIFKSLSFV